MSDLVEKWRAQMSRPHVIISETRRVGTALADENVQLRKALKLYGRHKPSCLALPTYCTCGFSAALGDKRSPD